MDLTEEEARLVAVALENYLPELREEIGKTEAFDVREALKRDEEALRKIIEKISALVD